MSIATALRIPLTCVSTAVLASFALGDILTVDDSGGMNFTDIQAAVNAATDGDTILVFEGSYAGFLVDGKALNVFAETNNVVNVTSTVQISNLVEPKRLVLSDLRITATSVYPQSPAALAMNVNTGSVRIQKCTLAGGAGTLVFDDEGEPFGSGGIGADLFFCTDVAFTACTILGGNGAGITTGYSFQSGGVGGKGVFARISAVALYDCLIRGGNGGDSVGMNGGNGGDGYHAPTGGFFSSGTAFRGGDGGSETDFVPWFQGGNGGDGIVSGRNSNIHLLDSTYGGGAGGFSFDGTNGTPGVGLDGGGIVEQLNGTRRKCTAASITAPASQLAVTITGQPGDQVYLPSSNQSFFKYRPGMHGTWLIAAPRLMTAQPIGVIPASGVLVTQIPIASSGSGAVVTTVQGLVVDTLGNSYIASPMHVLHQ